jgi:hypothetical protein
LICRPHILLSRLPNILHLTLAGIDCNDQNKAIRTLIFDRYSREVSTTTTLRRRLKNCFLKEALPSLSDWSLEFLDRLFER